MCMEFKKSSNRGCERSRKLAICVSVFGSVMVHRALLSGLRVLLSCSLFVVCAVEILNRLVVDMGCLLRVFSAFSLMTLLRCMTCCVSRRTSLLPCSCLRCVSISCVCSVLPFFYCMSSTSVCISWV
jgi:hypothetical protein